MLLLRLNLWAIFHETVVNRSLNGWGGGGGRGGGHESWRGDNPGNTASELYIGPGDDRPLSLKSARVRNGLAYAICRK